MTAEERLLSLVGGDAEPQLSSEELADCLLESAIPDAAGFYVNDVDYTPTYDFSRAAARGWRLKAAKVAADYSVTIEGRELNRGQMVDNFLKLAAEYDRSSAPRFFGLRGV